MNQNKAMTDPLLRPRMISEHSPNYVDLGPSEILVPWATSMFQRVLQEVAASEEAIISDVIQHGLYMFFWPVAVYSNFRRPPGGVERERAPSSIEKSSWVERPQDTENPSNNP